MRERFITGLVLLVLAMFVVVVLSGRSHAATTSAITYCETNPVGRHFETFIELANGDELTATDLRPGWAPILGTWRLIESPVRRHQRRIIDCVVVRVNGKRTAVLTTRGGAEWHVTRPWTEVR